MSTKKQTKTATAEPDGKAEQMPIFPAKIPKGRFARVPMTEFKGMILTGPNPTPGFTATIEAAGVIEPVVLFKPAEGRYKIGDGIRRIKAAQITEKIDIPAMIYEDEDTFRNACTLILNNQRSANPLAEVQSVMRLQRKGFGISQIAEATHLSKVRIEERLRLNNLIKPLYNAMFKGQIAVSIGAAASRLPSVYQKKLAALLAKKGTLQQKDVKDVKEVRRDAAIAALPAAIFADTPKQPVPMNESDQELLALFVRRYNTSGRGTGKVQAELDRQIALIMAVKYPHEYGKNEQKDEAAVNA